MSQDSSKPHSSNKPSNTHNVDLPDFDSLMKMANESPDELETLRRSMVEQLIRQAPKDTQRRLRGLQFKIDMERRRNKTPMSACIKMSEMMQESFIKLKDALNEVSQIKQQTQQSGSNITATAEAKKETSEIPSFGQLSPTETQKATTHKASNPSKVILFPQPT